MMRFSWAVFLFSLLISMRSAAGHKCKDERAAATALGYFSKSWGKMGARMYSYPPAEKSYHKKWSNLTSDEKKAAKVLGYKRQTWYGLKKWSQLTSDEKAAAKELGYKRQTWYGLELRDWTDLQTCASPLGTTGTCGGTAAGEPCLFPFEYKNNTYNECTNDGHNEYWCYTTKSLEWGNCDLNDELAGATALGYDLESWDYGRNLPPAQDKYWSQLNQTEKAAAADMGYDGGSWDGDKGSEAPPSGGKNWALLRTCGPALECIDQRAAATALGYNKSSWNNNTTQPLADDKVWSELNKDEKAAAADLGYSRESWDWDNVTAPPAEGKSWFYLKKCRVPRGLCDGQCGNCAGMMKELPKCYECDALAEAECKDELAAAKALGYHPKSWDMGAEMRHGKWSQLTSTEKAAAKVLGYEKARSWNGLKSAPSTDKKWTDLQTCDSPAAEESKNLHKKCKRKLKKCKQKLKKAVKKYRRKNKKAHKCTSEILQCCGL